MSSDASSTTSKPRRQSIYAFSTVSNINVQPSHELESQAICLFMQTFTASRGVEDSEPAHLDFLPQLYLTSPLGSCIREAVTSISLRNFSNRYGVANIGTHAYHMHGKALRSTKKALANPSQACLDETIATVYLLGLHELLSPSSDRGSWSVHVQGSLQLLRARGPDQLRTSRGRQIFRLVHTPILLDAMRNGTEPPRESLHLVRKMQAQMPPRNLFPSLVSELFYRVAVLRASLMRLCRNYTQFNHDAQRETLGLISEGQCIDQTFDLEAFAEIHQQWKVRSTSTNDSAIQESGEVCKNHYYFATMGVLAHWIKAWTARMYLYDTLTLATNRILEQDQPVLELTNREDLVVNKNLLVTNGRAAAACILRSIPFSLGQIDVKGIKLKHTSLEDPCSPSIGPMYVMYGLTSIVELPLMHGEQKLIAQQTLEKIGRERGILSPNDLKSELNNNERCRK